VFREIFESKLDIDKIQDLPEFADNLMMYILYNDKDVIPDLLKMDLKFLFTKPKKLYRIIRGKNPNDFKMNEFGITSASTGLLDADEMKDTISQYRDNGNFYLQEIQQAEGIDVTKLKKAFMGQKKRLTKLYDVPGNEPIDSLYDAFKLQQKEFIIFGNYKVTKTTQI